MNVLQELVTTKAVVLENTGSNVEEKDGELWGKINEASIMVEWLCKVQMRK